MASAQELRLVIVTPETTLLDESVQSIRFPLNDGQCGVLPGRAPLVGRLGYGELRAVGQTGELSYFIDGGFVQIKGTVVSILTSRSMPISEIDTTEAQELLETSSRLVPTSETEFAAKERDQARARQLLTLGKRAR